MAKARLPIIEIKNVSYWRKDQYILQNINWTVNSGDHWVLFGPNGAGKTTLLKLLTGYIRPSEGTALVLGETMGKTNLSELRKRIGWVSSSLESLIHNEDPAREIVVAGKYASTRLWLKVPHEDFIKAKQLLALLRCDHVFDSPYGILSQGERKKILIARALMTDPELLILDEPSEGLDIAAQEKFLQEITNLTTLPNPPTIILVTHHVEETSAIFNRILLLKNGQIFNQGSVTEILTSETISDLFEIPIKVENQLGRYFARLAK